VNSSRVIALRRHELLRVMATLDGGRGWTLMTASVYTAHAVFAYGRVYGHVIGTMDGWWWGLQTRPGQTPEVQRCDDLRQACLSARRAARQLVQSRIVNPGRPRKRR